MVHVKKDMIVSLRYIMKNNGGDILENTMNGTPASYLHGSGGIDNLLQEQLEGLKAGDKKFIYLSKASGRVTDDFTFDVIIDEVRIALDEELLLGYPVLQNPSRCGDDCECYK